MLSGRGVTNYNSTKASPSIGFSTETTEFDDALISRGIITFQQSMMRKGASAEQAAQLERIHLQQQQKPSSATGSGGEGMHGNAIMNAKRSNDSNSDADDDKDQDDDDDNDTAVFLERYRKERLNELISHSAMTKKHRHQPQHGEVYSISRPEWTRHVNEDSCALWVIVNLISSDTERTGCMELATTQLATKYSPKGILKVVHIAYHAAIPNWPIQNLPTLFCYRHGTLQHSFIQLPIEITLEELEEKLVECNVLEEDGGGRDGVKHTKSLASSSSFNTTSLFSAHDLEDYDEVD